MSNDVRERIAEEYKRCIVDPAHFMKKYCVIQHAKKGKMKFELYPYQEDVLRQFNQYDNNIILKARQLGLSTLVAAYSLWLMIFNSDKNILVIATKQDTAKNLVTKVRIMHDNLPSWMKGQVREDHKLSLAFKNGSQIKAVASSPDAGRSEALSLLIIDECAFVEGIDEIWKAAQATLATGGNAVLISTPNGAGNFFHEKWVQAKDEQYDKSISMRGKFNPILLDWRVHPERDEIWYNNEYRKLGDKGFRQEYECDFLMSGRTVIDPEIIEWYNKNQQSDIILEFRGQDAGLRIWEYPDPAKDYIVCADVARGDGGDYSAFHVLQVGSLKQVAEFKSKIDTQAFGRLLCSIGHEYNKALLVIENANIGWSTIQEVINGQYPNLYYSEQDLHYVDEGRQYTNKHRSMEKKAVAGFTTSTRTRPLIISKLEEMMRLGWMTKGEDGCIIRSDRLLSELMTFIWNGTKAEAVSGKNDDLIMSFAIGLWVHDTALKLRQQGIELNRMALERVNRHEHGAIYTPGSFKNKAYTMNIRGEEEDMTWLLD